MKNSTSLLLSLMLIFALTSIMDDREASDNSYSDNRNVSKFPKGFKSNALVHSHYDDEIEESRLISSDPLRIIDNKIIESGYANDFEEEYYRLRFKSDEGREDPRKESRVKIKPLANTKDSRW